MLGQQIYFSYSQKILIYLKLIFYLNDTNLKRSEYNFLGIYLSLLNNEMRY
jgi:hypothetical protein